MDRVRQYAPRTVRFRRRAAAAAAEAEATAEGGNWNGIVMETVSRDICAEAKVLGAGWERCMH